jgi:hypothetical protein
MTAPLVAAPGTIAALHGAYKARLADVAAAFPLLETKSGSRAPRLADGWLPPKDAAVEDFPFLALRPLSGADTEQGGDENATAVIQILIGTYSDTDDGWLDVALIIDAIRADLGAGPTIEGTAFEHIGPLTWELPEGQERPQWFGIVKTIWSLPRPRRVEARNPQED